MGVLVLASLVLLTLSFRSNALDGFQGTAASVLRPFQVGAERVARPFRDAADWARGLVDAKSENAKLRHQVETLRQQVVALDAAETENRVLRRQLDYQGPPSLDAFSRVFTSVLTNPQGPLSDTITIDAGVSSGVRAQEVVITSAGLVGVVQRAYTSQSRVLLITDELSAVTSTDSRHPASVGVVQRGNGSNVLTFDRVPKQAVVEVGDTIVTAGSPARSALPSLFPRGLPVGTVTSESDSDVSAFKNIQVQPSADLGSLQSVIVLVPKG